MAKLVFVALLALGPGVAFADTTITKHKDTLGYTHYDIRENDHTTRCISKKNTLGYTVTHCS
jgi:hypothetical protein